MCANQEVCPEVKDNLLKLGFKFLKDTPNSSDSDLEIEPNIEESEIREKGDKVFETCGKKVQQVSVTIS